MFKKTALFLMDGFPKSRIQYRKNRKCQPNVSCYSVPQVSKWICVKRGEIIEPPTLNAKVDKYRTKRHSTLFRSLPNSKPTQLSKVYSLIDMIRKLPWFESLYNFLQVNMVGNFTCLEHGDSCHTTWNQKLGSWSNSYCTCIIISIIVVQAKTHAYISLSY